MKFEIKDGLNKVLIGTSSIGSYFKIELPVTVVWNDNKGSVGKYIALLPIGADKRQALHM